MDDAVIPVPAKLLNRVDVRVHVVVRRVVAIDHRAEFVEVDLEQALQALLPYAEVEIA